LSDGIEKYKTTISATIGSGQIEQVFTLEDVEPGTYTIVIEKAVHTRFSVLNVVVGDKDVDLSQDSRILVRLMTLRCGDIDGDGQIGLSDLNILLSSHNYMKSTEGDNKAVNPAADLDGDGQIGLSDLNILLSSYNYMNGEVFIE
jgi:hypothetical protein